MVKELKVLKVLKVQFLFREIYLSSQWVVHVSMSGIFSYFWPSTAVPVRHYGGK